MCCTRLHTCRGSLAVTIQAVPSPKPNGPLALAFLAVLQDSTGWLGGYLVTNGWGRPLEFRLTTAVQPNRVQSVLYGPTLVEYLHADVIGKTLVEKTATKPDLIVTDGPPALALRARIEVPVVALAPPTGTLAETVSFRHARSSAELLVSARFASDRDTVLELLERADPAVDLAEPFARIREAVSEARKMGVTKSAA